MATDGMGISEVGPVDFGWSVGVLLEAAPLVFSKCGCGSHGR